MFHVIGWDVISWIDTNLCSQFSETKQVIDVFLKVLKWQYLIIVTDHITRKCEFSYLVLKEIYLQTSTKEGMTNKLLQCPIIYLEDQNLSGWAQKST